MPEPIDVYADQFMVTISPFGASLSFEVNIPHPTGVTREAATRLATIRMSAEHLKSLAVIITRQVKQAEAQFGVKYDVPSQVLAQLGIGREDWDDFWR